jgi:uncharacterized membrane protein YuzA (DUF378 family)
MDQAFIKKKSSMVYLHMICVILVLIGGFNWGLQGLFNFNLVKYINENTYNSPMFENGVYILVGISALYLASNRNTYLPFLGDTVGAPSLIRDTGEERKNANVTVVVDAEGASSVMYWAADPLSGGNEGEKFAYDAYGKYKNAGVAEVVNDKATLRVECPQKYWVKKFGVMKKTLPKHVHYRLIYSTGWISEVLTKKLDC